MKQYYAPAKSAKTMLAWGNGVMVGAQYTVIEQFTNYKCWIDIFLRIEKDLQGHRGGR